MPTIEVRSRAKFKKFDVSKENQERASARMPDEIQEIWPDTDFRRPPLDLRLTRTFTVDDPPIHGVKRGTEQFLWFISEKCIEDSIDLPIALHPRQHRPDLQLDDFHYSSQVVENAYEGREAEEAIDELSELWIGSLWLFNQEILWCKSDRVGPADVAALRREQVGAEQRRIERAHAVAAIATNQEQPRKRTPIPQHVRIEVWQRDEGRCVECRRKENLEFDHIIPFSMGGADTVRNIQLLCEGCNRAKGASLG